VTVLKKDKMGYRSPRGTGENRVPGVKKKKKKETGLRRHAKIARLLHQHRNFDPGRKTKHLAGRQKGGGESLIGQPKKTLQGAIAPPHPAGKAVSCRK